MLAVSSEEEDESSEQEQQYKSIEEEEQSNESESEKPSSLKMASDVRESALFSRSSQTGSKRRKLISESLSESSKLSVLYRKKD